MNTRILYTIILLVFCSIQFGASLPLSSKLLSSVVKPAAQQQRQYYNAHSYQYPTPQYPQYQQNANGYYYHAPPPRPQHYQVPSQPKKERSYKDICRMVNTNGFTNPGGVPKCPY